MILQLEELFFVELRQRGSRNIEAHMNRRRDFINVLPAGTLRTHRMDVDLCIRDRHVRRDVQHRELVPLPRRRPDCYNSLPPPRGRVRGETLRLPLKLESDPSSLPI